MEIGMDFLIGAVIGVWLLIVIWTIVNVIAGVRESEIDKNLKISIYIYVVLGLLYVIEAFLALGDKLVSVL